MTLLEKLKNMISSKREETYAEELPDEMTRDRYLRSLRRERRIQMEEVEKERLKKEIAEFKKNRERKYLWGVNQKSILQSNSILGKSKYKSNSGYFDRHKL